MAWDGLERRQLVTLSEEQMEELAERAAQKAIASVYQEIGQSVVKKALWVIGVGTLALLVWLGKDGKLP